LPYAHRAPLRLQKNRGSNGHYLHPVDLVEINRDLFARCRMKNRSRFTLALGPELLGNSDVLGPAPPDRNAPAIRYCALELIVLSVIQLLQCFSESQLVATRVNTL